MDKLKLIQDNKGSLVSPVMVHAAPTGVCNLKCTYCCCADREVGQSISKERLKSAMSQFAMIGVKGWEWTGGGDPSMYKHIGEMVEYGASVREELGLTDPKGFRQGYITNGLKSPYLDFKTQWKHFDWVRLSFHAFNYLPNAETALQDTVDKIRTYAPNTDISSVYIWTKNSDITLERVIDFADKNKIPTRLTPDLTLGVESITKMMPFVKGRFDSYGSEYVFLSDFNTKTDRRNDHCFMHMVKPYIFTDGNVYVCPSAELAPENGLTVDPKFKVCGIEDIFKTYSTGAGGMRNHDCSFCKYSMANELIDDIVRPVKHTSFA